MPQEFIKKIALQDNHKTILDTLTKIREYKSNDPDWTRGNQDENLIFNPNFIMSHAWETAKTTQALNYLPYSTVKTLSSVYHFQNAYISINEKFLDMNLSVDFHDPAKEEIQMDITIPIIQNFISMEERLIVLFDSTLTLINESPDL